MGLFGGGGMFSMGGTAGKFLDPGDAFGIQGGRDAAARADDLGRQTLGMQQGWLDYLKGMNEPYMQAGQEALNKQMGMLPEMQAGPDYAAAANSPMLQQMKKAGESAITSGAGATGGMRGGNIQGALEANSEGALMSAANQNYAQKQNYFGNLGSISGAGMQAGQNLGSFGGDTMSGISGTMGGLASGGLNATANQTNQQTGIISAIGGMFSDKRLKDNIEFTGKYTDKGFRVYTWDWNDKAAKLHLKGTSSGVIADEVEITMPDAITLDKSGYKVVDYARL